MASQEAGRENAARGAAGVTLAQGTVGVTPAQGAVGRALAFGGIGWPLGSGVAVRSPSALSIMAARSTARVTLKRLGFCMTAQRRSALRKT